MNPLQADHGKGRSKLFMEHPGKAWFRILIGFQNNSPDPGMTFALEIQTEQLAVGSWHQAAILMLASFLPAAC